MIQCPLCNRHVTTINGLANHFFRRHPDTHPISSKGYGDVRCCCGKWFPLEIDLALHFSLLANTEGIEEHFLIHALRGSNA
jgi:hypothetical protein